MRFQNDIEHQKKLERLLIIVESSIRKLCYGAMITGSYSYSKDYNINSTSDLDIIVICENESITSLLKTPAFAGFFRDIDYRLNCLKRGLVDFVPIKHTLEDCTFGMYIIEPSVFEHRFSSIHEETLRAFKETKRKKERSVRYLNFDGRYIEIPTESRPVPGGYIIETRTCIFVGGRYYAGPPHNRLISNPEILFDYKGILEGSISRLRKQLVLQMIKEYGTLIDFENISLLNTLVHKDRLSPIVTKKLGLLERDEYSRIICA